MNWIYFAIFSYFLFAIVIALDKLILSKKLPHPASYAFFTGIIEIFALVLMPFGFVFPDLNISFIALLSGALYIFGLIFLFNAFARFEVSRVMPVVGAITPMALFLFSFFGPAEFGLTNIEISALVLLMLGGAFISYQKVNRREILKLLAFAVPAAALMALSYFLAKMVYNEANFITGFVLGRMGGFFAAASMLLFPTARQVIFDVSRSAERGSVVVIGVTKAVAALAFISLHYATFLGNVTLVQAFTGLQYVFLIFIAGALSLKFPAIFKEQAGVFIVARKISATLIIGVGIFILAFSEKPAALAPGVDSFGATFSIKYAKDMKLDWREAYLAVLDDLKVKRLRIPAYWDEIESNEGKLNFSDLDWQLAEAEKREIKVVLSIGYRLPRWPECHIPKWAKDKPRADFENDALDYLKTTIERYRSNRAVTYWQIENEPFLRGFGECPKFSAEFLDKEIALARSLDPRPIVVSDSGELSLWFQAAKRADIFGTTMYRTIWNKYLGYFNYPLPPEFFHLKANIVRSFGTMRRAIVIELQAEPWGPKMAYDLSPEEEQESFSPQKFRDNIKYAKAVGFPEVYLWGAEWWYWKKQKGDDRYWEIAKEIFKY